MYLCERESTHAEQGKRKNPKQTRRWVWSPTRDSISQDRDLSRQPVNEGATQVPSKAEF